MALQIRTNAANRSRARHLVSVEERVQPSARPSVSASLRAAAWAGGSPRLFNTLSAKFAICWHAPSTTTAKLAVALFPAASVAVHVTAVEPIGKRLPDDGAHVTVGGWPLSSVAAAANVTIAPSGRGGSHPDGPCRSDHSPTASRRSRG